MRWTLFARLEQTVDHARRLDPHRDAPCFAEELLASVPEIFTKLSPARSSRAAHAMAEAALHQLRQLPHQINEDAATLVDPPPLPLHETLARTAALAYVACADDFLSDDLPAGYGLIDDALLLRAAEVGPASTWTHDQRVRRLGAEARFLSLFLPRALLPKVDAALDELFAIISSYARFPRVVLEETTRRLIERPPEHLSELLPRPEAGEDRPRATVRPPLFSISEGRVGELDDDRLRFEFDDGVALTLRGHLLEF
jgi:hypothetical protein